MGILSKLKTVSWYLLRPKYYREFFSLLRNRLLGNKKENTRQESIEWCQKLEVDTNEAIRLLTGKPISLTIDKEFEAEFEEAHRAESTCPVKMGGAGNLDLVYHLCEFLEAREVVETGVAYGWSSLAILLSLQKRKGHLRSVDMPYAKMGNDDFVGIVVPQKLRENWELIRLPDSKGLKIALDKTRQLDLCHYDSDKTYAGRMFAYPLLWEKLRSGGIFMSDDIQDNLGFRDWCNKMKLQPVIIGMNGKYIGVIKKQ